MAKSPLINGREIDDTWQEYVRTRSPKLREQLIEAYLPQVARIASRIRTRVPKCVQLDDLVSAGTFGLMYAIGAFDLKRQVKFETFCQQRVRGAILDHLRSCDVMTRQTRARINLVQQISAEFQNRLGRTPTDDELRSEMKLKPQQFDRLMKYMQASQTISLSRPRAAGDGQRDLVESDLLEDQRQMPVMHDLQRQDLLKQIVSGLSRQKRLIITLYYYEQLTMREVGDALGISESRVSQLHDLILTQLRHRVTNYQTEMQEMAA